MPNRDEILTATPEQLLLMVAEARGCTPIRFNKPQDNYGCGCNPDLPENQGTWPHEAVTGRLYDWPTDIAAAWELVEEMSFFRLTRRGVNRWECWSVQCRETGDHTMEYAGKYACDCRIGTGRTAPVAICRAYLLAKQEE